MEQALLFRSLRPRARGPLVVMPGVFDPVATKVGDWFGRALAEDVIPGESWLDLGCGTGVVGIALAEAGARVTCADVDPRAVRNAAANAVLRGVTIHTAVSDLVDGLAGQRFDHLAANLPFWPGDPQGRTFGRAFYAGEDFALLRRFANTFRTVANDAYVVLSERGGNVCGAREALGPHRLYRRARVRGEWLLIVLL